VSRPSASPRTALARPEGHEQVVGEGLMREQDGAGKDVLGRLHVEQMAVRQASPIGDLVLDADVCHGETEGERRFDLAGRGRQVDDGEDVLDLSSVAAITRLTGI
jgi:hypothetical protein